MHYWSCILCPGLPCWMDFWYLASLPATALWAMEVGGWAADIIHPHRTRHDRRPEQLDYG